MGDYTLWRPIQRGDSDAVRVSLGAASDLEHVIAKDAFGMTALHWAALGGHSDIVKLLLEAAPNVEHVTAKDVAGWTALHWAALGGHSDSVKLLLEAAPNVEHVAAKSRFGRTALHWAEAGGHSEAVKLLFGAAPNVEHVIARDAAGRTALHLAAQGGHSDSVKLLLEAAPNVGHVSAKGRNDTTALLLAALGDAVGNVDAMKLVLAASAVDANETNGGGDTFLHCAVRHGYADIVKGAVPTFQRKLNLAQENVDGKTAIQIAYEKEFFDIEQALLECGAVKSNIEALYRDRQVYVDSANAILVGAALIASVTFSSTSYPASSDPKFADVEHNIGLGVFWVFNSLSFYFAIGTVVLAACSVLPRRRLFIKENLVKLQQNLLWTCGLLTCSVFFILIAFATARYIVLVPILKF